jgi:hypothetical protein
MCRVQGHPAVEQPARKALSHHRNLAQACSALRAGLLPLGQALQQQDVAPLAQPLDEQAAATDPAVVRRAAGLLSALEPHLPAAEAQVRKCVLTMFALLRG